MNALKGIETPQLVNQPQSISLFKLKKELEELGHTVINLDDGLVLIGKNIYHITEHVTKIVLSNTEEPALIDTDNLFDVLPYSWCQHKVGYAHNYFKNSMHQLLMNYPKGMQVDHLNKERLDNRIENLRIVTKNQNLENRSVLSKTSNTGFTGIKQKKSGSFNVTFQISKKTVNKIFPTLKEAFIHRIFLIRVHNTHHLLCHTLITKLYSDDELWFWAQQGEIDNLIEYYVLRENK